MIKLFLLLFAILMVSAGVYRWLRDTMLASGLAYIYSAVVATVFISFLFDISVVLSLPVWDFVLISILISFALLYYQWRHGGLLSPGFSDIFGYRSGIYSIVVLALVYYLSSMFIPHSGRWGRWDARAIWTLHALFITHPHEWTNLFSPAITWSHPDYPLLLSSLISMCWSAMGTTDAIVPCVIAYLIFIAVLMAVCKGLEGINRWLAILGLLLFAFTNAYIRMAASQGADTLLSLFILMALVLARQNAQCKSKKLLLLTGFILGCAGWVKNEGIAFTILFSIAMFWRYRKVGVLMVYYIGGMALPLMVIILFKAIYAPANDIMAGQDQSVLAKIIDISRYMLTAQFFVENIRHLYPSILVIGALVIMRSYRRLWDWQLLIILLMMSVYFFTFIITPRDLRWHLETAFDRLLLQLFPALVYVLLCSLGGEKVNPAIS